MCSSDLILVGKLESGKEWEEAIETVLETMGLLTCSLCGSRQVLESPVLELRTHANSNDRDGVAVWVSSGNHGDLVG